MSSTGALRQRIATKKLPLLGKVFLLVARLRMLRLLRQLSEARVHLLTALGGSPAALVARADLENQGVGIVDFADDDFQFPVSAILVDEVTSERSVVSLDGGRWNPDFGARSHLVSNVAAEGWPDAIMFDGHHPKIAAQAIEFLSGSYGVKNAGTDESHNSAIRSGASSQAPLVVLDGGRWRPIFAELIPIADVAAISVDFSTPDGRSVLGLGGKTMVVTNGPDPVYWETSTGERGQVNVPKVHARDTLGAGDAFHGALTYHLARLVDLPSAVAKANQVAATKVQYLGTRDWLKKI